MNTSIQYTQENLINEFNNNLKKFREDCVGNPKQWWMDIVQKGVDSGFKFKSIARLYRVGGDDEISRLTNEAFENLHRLELLYMEKQDYPLAIRTRELQISFAIECSASDFFKGTNSALFQKMDENTICFYRTTPNNFFDWSLMKSFKV